MQHTLAALFDVYFKACYKGKDISETQRKEVRQAFYSGALTTFELMEGASARLTEDEAFRFLDAMKKETLAFGLALKSDLAGTDPAKQ